MSAEVALHTQPELALTLIDQARTWAVPCASVVTEAGDGDNPTLLLGLFQDVVLWLIATNQIAHFRPMRS